MTENTVDEVARARIDAHEKGCDQRMDRIEGMFGEIKTTHAEATSQLWTAIESQRERSFAVVLRIVPWALGGMGLVVIALGSYIFKGMK
jgi:hypothetical protein